MTPKVHKFLVYLISVYVSIKSIDCTKWLLNSPGFDSPDGWDSGYLPCSQEKVIFPADYDAVLLLPKKVDINGFKLPQNGAILLNQDATINFGAEPARSCENGKSHEAYIKKPATSKWFDPHSWRTNDVLPDMEQVPCNNDSVVIQLNGPVSIDLESVTYLRIGQLHLAGSSIAKDYLVNLMSSDIGQLLFKHSDGVAVEYYRNDVCGCHKDFPDFIEPICHNVVERCARPHCLVPVTPLGSCCPVCGAVVRLTVDNCDDAKLYMLKKLISVAIREQKLTDELDYHVNYFNQPPYGNYLQAIIMDREDYSEKSVAFVNRLQGTKDWLKVFKGPQHLEVQVSGRPYNPNITFFSVLLIILCVLLVSIVALVIFAHYAPDHRYLRRVPQWAYDPNRWRTFILHSPFVFARFDNAAAGAGARGARESDVHDSVIMGYDAESGEVRERAFDNPMFGNAPQEGVTATTAAPKDVSKPTQKPAARAESSLETGTLVDDAEGDEEQELTEIKLESSSDNSSDEEETKE